MFCLLVVLVELSVLLLAKWLARKTPLRKPNRGEGIVSRKTRPKSAHNFLGLLYYFIVLLCICVISCPYVIYYPTVMARYSIFVLKVPLNPKQTNKHHLRHQQQVDLLTLKLVSESSVTWATSMPILLFLGLSVLELGPLYATDRQTSDRQTLDRSIA